MAAFYDCIQMFAYAFNKSLNSGTDFKDARTVIRNSIWNSTFRNGSFDILIKILILITILSFFQH